MTDMDFFQNKKPTPSKLARFGLAREGAQQVYRTALSASGFVLTMRIAEQGMVCTEVVDPDCGEPYVLHRMPGVAGSFVGGVRSQYEAALAQIGVQCFEPDAFQSRQAAALLHIAAPKHLR